MANPNLKRLCESHIEDAGSVKEGVKRFAKDTVNFINDGTIKPEEVSIKEVFNQTTLREFKEREGEDLDTDTAGAKRIAEAIGHSHFPFVTKELINKELLPEYEFNNGNVDALVSYMDTKRTDFEYVAGIKALSQMSRVRPGQPYPNAEFGEKNIRVEIAKWGEILNLEAELIMQDQTGKVLERARMAGKFMGEQRHRFVIETAMDIKRDALEEGTSTAFHYMGSAVTVYANDHSSDLDQALDNLAASSALATAGLDTAFGLFGSMKDEEGRYILAMPKVLLVNPSLYRTAWQFTSDETQPDTGNRGSNFYKKALGLTAMQSPYIGTGGGASTDWYLGDFKRQLVWIWAKRPYTDSEGADSASAFERDIVARFKYGYWGGCGHRDTRYIVKGTV